MDAQAGARYTCVYRQLNAQLPPFFALICHLFWRTLCNSAWHCTTFFESMQVISLFIAQEPVSGLPLTTFRHNTLKHQQSLLCALQFDHCHLFFSYGKFLKQLL